MISENQHGRHLPGARRLVRMQASHRIGPVYPLRRHGQQRRRAVRTLLLRHHQLAAGQGLVVGG
jgi:hypothetical protein